MSNTQKYLDKATELMKLVHAGEQCVPPVKTSRSIQGLEKELAELWNKMSEEEKLYVDEQTIRISQWIGYL